MTQAGKHSFKSSEKLKPGLFFRKQESTKSEYFFCDLYVVILLVLDDCFLMDSVLSRLVPGTLVEEDGRVLLAVLDVLGLSTGSEPSGNLGC
jgi:hypothetical protein